jgi:FkbM family methyltransferase
VDSLRVVPISDQPAHGATDEWAAAFFYGNMIRSSGCVIDTNDPSVTPWVRSLIFWGFYERPERQFVKKYITNKYDVIELGGSIGVVSAQIGRCLQPGRQLVCVEANPSLVRLLRENATRNARGALVTVHNSAIAYGMDQAGFVDLNIGKTNLGARISQSAYNARSCRVPTTTLASLVSRHEIGAFVLVSDIEGAEARLLRFDAQALVNCQLLIIELHDAELEGSKVSVADLVRDITDRLGFILKDQSHNVFVFEGRNLAHQPCPQVPSGESGDPAEPALVSDTRALV